MTACRQLRLKAMTDGGAILVSRRYAHRVAAAPDAMTRTPLDVPRRLAQAARPAGRAGWRRLAGVACFAASLCAAAGAAAADPAAPPARIGQVAFIAGAASMRLDAGAPWQPAELNMPMAAHTALATGLASRAELRVGSSALWLAPASELSLTEFDDSHLEAEIARGRVVLRVRALPAGDSVALTAEGARLVLAAAGAYRTEYEPRRHRLVVHVVEGRARLVLRNQDVLLNANQWATADLRTQAVVEQGSGDTRVPLDELAERRDRRDERSAALARLPAEMTGAAALDGQGAWRDERGYGPVWTPDNLPPDWAPYRYGHWRWLPPWGWNWVDDATWGFAPSHYGRWVFLSGRWGWAPGLTAVAAATTRPVYAPALVGFYGSGEAGAWSPAATSAPVVGWYPLAPGEVYWPAYTAQLGYVRAVNAATVADAAQLRAWPEPNAAGPSHRYARTAFAATAVPEANFRAMQPVAPRQLALPPAALAQAPLSGRRAPPGAAPEAATPAREGGGPADVETKPQEPVAEPPRAQGAGKQALARRAAARKRHPAAERTP
jgi:hypothetical protein